MYSVSKEHQIILASEPSKISELEAFIEKMRDELEISDEVYGNIMICLTEAVNNCITHGNKSNSSKYVVVSCRKENEQLVFVAADEGSGFDFENLPDPTAPENIERVTGRGVFLMRQLSDSLIYTNGGATVEMRFKV